MVGRCIPRLQQGLGACTRFSCEDRAASGLEPCIETGTASRCHKHAIWCTLLVAFCVSTMVGFCILGPVVSNAWIDSQGTNHGLSKSMSMMSVRPAKLPPQHEENRDPRRSSRLRGGWWQSKKSELVAAWEDKSDGWWKPPSMQSKTEEQMLAREDRALLKNARGDKEKMMKAYRSLKSKLETDPQNVPLKVACADALVSVMRIVGHANALTCHFKDSKPEIRAQDTTQNKAFWANLAPKAQSLLADVENRVGSEEFNRDASMFSLGLETLMYATSSKGIASAVASGKASAFSKRIAQFEKLHPDAYDSNYCIYNGAYLIAAPWPVHNAKKALSYLELAAKKCPASMRNQYFAGVGRFAVGDYTGARKAMEKALQQPSPSPGEEDIRDFLKTEATRTVKMLKAKGY